MLPFGFRPVSRDSFLSQNGIGIDDILFDGIQNCFGSDRMQSDAIQNCFVLDCMPFDGIQNGFRLDCVQSGVYKMDSDWIVCNQV